MSDTREDGDSIARGFDAAAAEFTSLGEHLWGPIGEALVAVASPQPGERVLDACCGTGASAVPAAQRVGPDGVVDAVDVSAPMITELRARAAHLPQLRTHRLDITAWDGGGPPGYDVVQSGLGIFFLPDMTAGTEGLIAMARPGGRVAFAIWRGDAMAAAGRQLNRAVAAVTGGEEAPPRKPYLIDRINQPECFAQWLGRRGLSDVNVAVNERSLTMDPDLAWLVILGSGFRRALAQLPDDAVASVRERYLSLLDEEGIDALDATTLIGSGTTPAAPNP
ncbi:ubiquinone biosynthesis methyltransferase UbiE [Streptomonospora alba]|uniref:Ubiquinone biosynthesis methyltransferase UbiE n=1 Tax=Streptomonospora alba TaxID=183763 RepID=A0A0C2JJE1_9ACTN|nr:class I SAM-dependent methyltransferase [Streptomonospora alba]KIH99050.1 ubiquinone biosynthesis methyltransferase UbiE [Streptomonospora alba]